MFKKLKDKIAEEVKISPQRIQQFTQSVTDKLQTATADDNLFSLTEEDTPQSPPPTSNDAGFTNVSLHASTPKENRSRRFSNSSMASDVSYLPTYESSTTAYHLQSDLEMSASEMEDNVSTASSQLGHISKEKVYADYQKTRKQYHLYRGRFKDLAKHYHDLERENDKIKGILGETQDKAIRRISELREQCNLSQRAKADLEHALRTEIEEKQLVINTLKEKVDLLQCNSENDKPLVEITNPAVVDDLNEKIQELKANAIVLQTKDAENKEKIAALERLVEQVKEENKITVEREKSNNLKFAKSKLELHTELQNRDLEISNLKKDLETVKHELESYENQKGGPTLKAQNSKLIEKCEQLAQKCQNYESDLLKIEQYKIEISDLRKQVGVLKESLSGQGELKIKLDEVMKEREQLEQQLVAAKEKTSKLFDENRESENNFKEIQKANSNLLQTLTKNEEQANSLRSTIDDLNKKVNSLQTELSGADGKYKEQCSRIQDEAKQSLLSLESRVKQTLEETYGAKEVDLRKNFEEKLRKLEANSEDSKQTQIKLMKSEENAIELGNLAKKLQIDLEKKIAAYKELETNHLGLIDENNGRGVRLSNLEKELFSREADVTAANERCQIMKKELADINERFDSVCGDMRERLNQLESEKKDADVVRANLEKSENNAAELGNLIRKLEQDLEDQIRSYGALKEENDARIERYKLKEAKSAALLSAEINKLENTLRELVQTRKDNDEQKQIVNSLKEELKVLYAESENQQKKLAEALKELKSDIARKQSEVIETKAILEKECSELKEANSKLSSKLSAQNKVLSQSNVEITKLTEDLSEFKEVHAHLVQYKEDNTKLVADLAEIKLLHDQLQKDYSEISESYTREKNNFEDIRSQTESLSSLKSAAESELEAKRAIIEEMQKELKNLHGSLSNLSAADEELIKTKVELSNYQNEVSLLKKKMTKLSNDYAESKKSNMRLSTELEDAVVECKRITTERISLAEQLETMKTREADLREQKRVVDEEMVELRRNAQVLKSEFDELENVQNRLNHYETVERKDLSGRVEDLQKRIRILEEIETKYKLILDENHNLKEQQSKLDEFADENRLLHETVNKLNAEITLRIKEQETSLLEIQKQSSVDIKQRDDALEESRQLAHTYEQKLRELEDQIDELKSRTSRISSDNELLAKENEQQMLDFAELKVKHESFDGLRMDFERKLVEEALKYQELMDKLKQVSSENLVLKQEKGDSEQVDELRIQINSTSDKFQKLLEDNNTSKAELNLSRNQIEILLAEQKRLQASLLDFERHCSELSHEKQLLSDEVAELKTAPLNFSNGDSEKDSSEIFGLREKLAQYKSIDVTNRNSIEFYENELQKMKNKNEKLNRKLDETLVTLNHCAELSASSTEIEYLRNVLYNYMLGKESLVMARVLAAVCKFDQQQTDAVIKHEQHKQSLLGHLGII